MEELPPPAQSQFSISSPDEVVIPPTTPDDTTVPSVTGEGTMSDGKGNLKKVLFERRRRQPAAQGKRLEGLVLQRLPEKGLGGPGLAAADEEARAEGGRARSERAQEHE